ncbi:MAG: DUF2493 domain-containing protein [Clostridiales bacterium]|nr:DUF2493 domain-containing protein [Clostridiales bacterium]
MKVAVIGSRKLNLSDFGGTLADFLPPETTAIVSGGAKGIDSCARDWALANGIEIIEFLPDYRRYGRGAPHRRNDEIIAEADLVLAFWDGESRRTASVITKCRNRNVPVRVISPEK